jgi:hypothetical protein
MDVGQMVCHLADSFRLSLGDLQVQDISTFFTRTVLRWMVLSGMPTPKGKIATYREMDQVAGHGTRPTTLDADRAQVKALVERFVAAASENRVAPSPAFGRLSGRQYARLQYLHMDHHLRQFGV